MKKKVKRNSLGASFNISFTLLVVTLLLWGATNIANMIVADKGAKLNQEMSIQQSTIIGEDDLQRVADFQRRAELIKTNMDSKYNMKEMLQTVQQNMVQGVFIISYNFEQGNIRMLMSADSYKSISRQIVSFKKK